MSINPPLSGLCEQRPFAERRGLIHQPQFFALYKETPMAFRIKPAGASGSRVCGMAASLPNEAEFGFWPPRFLKQKPVAFFCFFTSPEGQLPRRGIVVIGAGPKAIVQSNSTTNNKWKNPSNQARARWPFSLCVALRFEPLSLPHPT